jgi:hypothetical protein
MTSIHHPSRRHPALIIGAVTTTVLLAACGPARTPDAAASGLTPEGPPVASSGAVPAGTAPAAPAQAYVDAVNAGNLDALVAAFAPDGLVIDVTRPIRGRDAIRAWADSEVIGGRLQVLSVNAMSGGQDLLVYWAPEGSAGWQAHYRFTMNATAIIQADLQYA